MGYTAAATDPSAVHSVGASADLFRLVVRKSETIVALNRAPADAPRLYCIHSVAGDITDYRGLAHLLDGAVAVCGVQVPLDKMQADAVTSIEQLSSRYAGMISLRQPSGPILLGGFSAGAIIALEVAQQLIAAGREVPLLVAFDGAPSNTPANLPKIDPRYWLRLVANFVRCVRGGQAKEWIRGGLLWRLTFSFFLRPSGFEPLAHGSTFYKNAMRLVTDRCGWKPEQMTFLRGMIDAMSVYRAKKYPGCVLVFETRFQPIFHAPQIADVWKSLSEEPRIYGLDANHGTLFRNEHAVARMASVILRECSRMNDMKETRG